MALSDLIKNGYTKKEGLFINFDNGEVVDGVTDIIPSSTTQYGDVVTYGGLNRYDIHKDGLYYVHMKLTTTNAAHPAGNYLFGGMRPNGNSSDLQTNSFMSVGTSPIRRLVAMFGAVKPFVAGDYLLSIASEVSAGSVSLETNTLNCVGGIYYIGDI